MKTFSVEPYLKPPEIVMASPEVILAEICIACTGEGKLPTFQSHGKLIHLCPWCDGKKEVSKEVNDAFIRVLKTLPNQMQGCVVFGCGGQDKSLKEVKI